MEWNSKLPAWDFSDLDQSGELVSVALGDGAGLVVGAANGGVVDCSVDLKLGALGEEVRPPGKYWTSQPAAAPPRRGRAGGSGAACLVDGCRSDLSNSREYHRRHKVCETHSKTPVVLVGGQEQRFCQQCSRFHQLVEFDEVKRSCRKRLDGHNRRRRKPQPESTTTTYAALFQNQVSRGLIHSHLTSATPTFANSLPQQQPSGLLCTTRNLKQFPFLQQEGGAAAAAATGFSRAATTLPAVRESSSRRDSELDCALSLLSSAPNPSAAMGQMVPAGRIPMHRHNQSLLPGLPYNSVDLSTAGFSCLGIEVEQVVDTVFNCEAAAGAGLHCQTVFNVVGEGSSPQALLPFSWQ